MFTHLLPKDNVNMTFHFCSYADRHYLKNFEKKCPKRQWELTLLSIEQDLSRIRKEFNDIQQTQQVDELWHNDQYWIFKYDFRIAQTKESAKSSGNRCICFLNLKNKTIDVLLIYNKNDLPKNIGEQAYIEKTLKAEFPDYYSLVTK